jgi:hypothetical protein
VKITSVEDLTISHRGNSMMLVLVNADAELSGPGDELRSQPRLAQPARGFAPRNGGGGG